MSDLKISKSISLNTINNYDKLTSYTNYDTTIDNVMDTLKEYGVAVIPNILNNEEIENMRNGVWDTMEYKTSYFDKPLNRNDVDTWDAWYKLFPTKDMLLQTFNVGQSQFLWDVRQNPKVVNVFSKIWNVEPKELISSFDAVSFHLPPEITNRGFYNNDDWFHIDSSYLREEFDCVQGFVTGYDINEGDGTLTLLEGSHKYHQEFREHFDVEDPKDWFRLSEEELGFYHDKKCNRTNVSATAGSLVLWDSRLVHCGMQPLKTRKEPNFRLVGYVCMTPKSFATDEIIEKRIAGFENMYTSTHCPHRPGFFPTIPRYQNIDFEVPICVKPELTDLGKSLVGYDV